MLLMEFMLNWLLSWLPMRYLLTGSSSLVRLLLLFQLYLLLKLQSILLFLFLFSLFAFILR